MDALFQTQSNELSTITQKEKLFKDAERQWNTLSSEKGAPGRKVDFEIYKSILYNLEIRKVVGMTPLQYISQSRSPFMIQRN